MRVHEKTLLSFDLDAIVACIVELDLGVFESNPPIANERTQPRHRWCIRQMIQDATDASKPCGAEIRRFCESPASRVLRTYECLSPNLTYLNVPRSIFGIAFTGLVVQLCRSDIAVAGKLLYLLHLGSML